MEEDAFDALEKRKSTGGGSGDFAPWWEPNEGDTLVGVVVEQHEYNGPGADGQIINTVRSVGEGNYSRGKEVSTPVHTVLLDLLENVQVNDAVLLQYDGEYTTDNNMVGNDYSGSILTRDDWSQTHQADLFGETLQNSDYTTGTVTTEDSAPTKAVEFAEDVVEMNGGSVELDEFDTYLNEVRDYDVDPDNVIAASGGLGRSGDTVKKD